MPKNKQLPPFLVACRAPTLSISHSRTVVEMSDETRNKSSLNARVTTCLLSSIVFVSILLVLYILSGLGALFCQARQRLIYRGKVLADAEPLSTYKVEDGHYVHMVARPQGVPPPLTSATVGPSATGDGHASQAATGTPVGTRPVLRAATGARAERTLGERLLMGMGVPPFAQGEGGGGLQQGGRPAGIAAVGGGGDAEVNNAAEALGSGDFLSNMLGLGTDNAHPQNGARTGWTEGRGTRGQRRDGASGGTAAAGGGAGGQPDLEHVRQGLLTLHTLLSGSTARREEAQERSAGAGLRGTGTAGNALEERPLVRTRSVQV